MSPYALAKYSSELYAIKSRQTKNNLICIRPFNTFGPYQSEKAIIPELIIKCLLGKDIKTTSGEQTREFNYVENIIDGILLACNKITNLDHPINLGSKIQLKLKILVKKFISILTLNLNLKFQNETVQMKFGKCRPKINL